MYNINIGHLKVIVYDLFVVDIATLYTTTEVQGCPSYRICKALHTTDPLYELTVKTYVQLELLCKCLTFLLKKNGFKSSIVTIQHFKLILCKIHETKKSINE